MADHFSDQELAALFQRHLPHKPLPPDLADRLKQQVLAAVATTLQALPRPDASLLPLEATPALQFVAEQADEQALYDLFQKHMRHGSPSPELALHLQQQVAAAVGTTSPAARLVPATHPARRRQSQSPVQSPGTRWAVWRTRLRALFAHPPALALGGVASVLLVMLVLIGLSHTLRPPVPPPASTLAPGGATSAAPNTVLRQAHLTITSGQAVIQKPSGQTETVAAGTTIHWLAPGDRLITGESTVRIEYFPGQSTTVEPGAEVELQEYAAAGTTTRVALLVHSGKTSHEVNTPLAETDLFEIRTPAAVASAKYTKLTVEVLSETQTHIETEAGTAQVTTDNQDVVIAAGQQMTATTDNPWSMAPLSEPTTETIASPFATPTTSPSPTPTATASATAITLMQFSEPLLPTRTATPDEADLDIPPSPIAATHETIMAAPTTTPTSTPVQPTMTATSVVPTYVMILVPTETPTGTPTSTPAIMNTAEPSTDTPLPTMSTPVGTTTPTHTPVLSTRTPTPTATPTSLLVPTATKLPAPTQTTVPTATKTPAPTQTAVPSATKTPAPTYTPTPTTMPTNIPAVSPTATNPSVPSPTPTNSPESLPTATDTPMPSPTATDTPEPTSTPTDTPVPSPTATDTPEPTATDTPGSTVTPTDTPVPSPTATDTPEPTVTATDTPVPSPTATDTPEPTATDTPGPTVTPTDTPVPSPTATDTLEPTVTPTDTPEAIVTPTDTPLPS